MQDKKLLKQDINFLEYSSWVVDNQTKLQRLFIQKTDGSYEITSPHGLPTHFDQLLLYCLLSKLWKEEKFESVQIRTTRYELANDILGKATASYQFKRIMISLKKWQAVSINFDGLFYAKEGYTTRFFHVIEDVIHNKQTKQLIVRFNMQYLEHLLQTKFCKYIDFNEYKKLTKSVSARLYEILIKTFKGRVSWSIDIQSLAEKLTLEKRPQAQAYYPSDVLIKLKPALKEISEKTELTLILHYNKETGVCLFKNSPKKECKQELTIQAATVSTVSHEQPVAPIVSALVSHGVSLNQAQTLAKEHSADKIAHKIELLKRGTKTIKNVTAWLIQALQQDWNAQEYNKQQEAQRQEAERVRMYKEQERAQKREKQLRLDFEEYQRVKAQNMYNALSLELKKLVDAQLKSWVEQQARGIGLPLKVEDYVMSFLVHNLLPKEDLDFNRWVASIKQKHVSV